MGIENIFEFMKVASAGADRCVLNLDSLKVAVEKHQEACGHAQAARSRMREAYATILARRDDVSETLSELEDAGPDEFADSMTLLASTKATLDDMLLLSEKISEDLTRGIDELQTQDAHGNAAVATLWSAIEILRGIHPE